jgi:hypothetical protein
MVRVIKATVIPASQVAGGPFGGSITPASAVAYGPIVLTQSNVVTRGVSIENPSATEDITLFRSYVNITVLRVDAVLDGSVSPEITFEIWHGVNRNSGTEIKVGGFTVSGDQVTFTETVFDDAAIPAGHWVWLTTSAKSGIVDLLNVTISH